LIIINFLIIVSAGFLMPVWGEFVKRIHGDIRTAGNAICLFSIVIGFLTWIAGKIENRFQKHELVMIISQAMFVLSYLGYFWVDSPQKLYLVQIALGISGAIQVPALYTLYEKYIPTLESTFYWALWAGSYNIAIGVGSLVSAYTVHHFGFNAMLTVLVGFSAICFLFTNVVMGLIRKSR
jgi:predicted MFS family arabinose efflux permease